MAKQYDVAIVGAGILGLAHAYHLARQGRRVVVLERGTRATGASIRNFGMLWPIGQPPGPLYDMARRSLEHWHGVLQASGLWYERTGSLHVAYHEDEMAVLEEFVSQARAAGIAADLLDAESALKRAPLLEGRGLRGALWSAAETCVDPRQVIAGLPSWLSDRYGVRFELACVVTGYDHPYVRAGDRELTAERLLVCSGDDVRTLYPEVLGRAGLVPCKLQMMRSVPYRDWRVGPMLAAGLTLAHYRAFADCPSLPNLLARFDRELPSYRRSGIHVMVSQNGAGELTIGDSHIYGDAIEPFDRSEIDELILDYLRTFFPLPDLRIAARWHGIYAKHPTAAYIVERPAAHVVIVTGVGGAGMTLSFGLAEKVVREYLDAA